MISYKGTVEAIESASGASFSANDLLTYVWVENIQENAKEKVDTKLYTESPDLLRNFEARVGAGSSSR